MQRVLHRSRTQSVQAGCSRGGEAVAVLEIRSRICYGTVATQADFDLPYERARSFAEVRALSFLKGSFLHRRFSSFSQFQIKPDPERKSQYRAPEDDNNLIVFREGFLLFCFKVIQRKPKFRFHSHPLDQDLTNCACAKL
ncbi:hypothetical protein VWZ88_16000 [Phaeobacter sp. JH20_36]|uniref:hypothetical protein n=1 Tax=unclassified Phaeobacter TaxID=2621772 RepID=UPI003A8487AF